MPHHPNKISQFWQELKRRKVIKVVAAYAATAYIILEASDIVLPRLGLPDWTVTFLIVLIIAGFPITVILSWIFDITPGGIQKTEPEDAGQKESTGSRGRRFKTSDGIIAALIIAVVILAYPRIFRKNNIEDIRSRGRISLAVLPFQNLTNDTTWDVWQPGIQNNLITHLSNYSDELTVRQIESVNHLAESEGLTNNVSITPVTGSRISRKLGAEVFILGTITSDPQHIRINARLIHSTSREVFRSFQIEVARDSALSFQVIDELTGQVKDYLLLSRKQQEVPDLQLPLISTNEPEAYSYFVQGKEAFAEQEYHQAIQLFTEALSIDTSFTFATILLSWSYLNIGEYEKAKQAHQVAYDRRESLPAHLRTKMMDQHAHIYGGPEARIKYLKQLPEYDDRDPFNHWDLGCVYLRLEDYHKAIAQFNKALEIYREWGTKPFWVYDYIYPGYAYHQTGQYRKEKRMYRKAEKDFPDHPDLLRRQAIFHLHRGKPGRDNKYLEQYINILRYNSVPEADITARIASAYWEADLPDKAENAYRKVISEFGETPSRLNDLASFLIETEKGVEEGLELIGKALEMRPGDYTYLDTRGWGLYKLGRYEEALQVLNTAWDNSPIFSQYLNQHIREVEQALALQDKP